MDQNDGLEAKIFKEDNRTTLTMDSGEYLLLPLTNFLQDQTSPMGTTIRTTEDPMINAQISRSTDTMEIDPEMDLSTTRMGTGGTMEISPILHRLQGETSHKIFHTANREMINLTTLHSADLTINSRLVLHLTNKTIIRYYLMWFASPQLTIPLMNYQIFAH